VRAANVGRQTLLRVCGPLDSGTTPSLREALQPFQRGSEGLTLDLRPVEYIETPGLRLLMGLNEELQAEGGQLRLVVRRGSRVERTLQLAGLDQQCAVFHTVRQAWSEPSGSAMGPTGGRTRGDS
jgi:anti-sigma B factor antagonist